jgi:hypothetical protein
MRAIHPKFLGKKSELFGLEMKDIFVCMGMILIMKLLNLNDFLIILIPGIYLHIKFLINLFFPKFHLFFLFRRKKYFEWNRHKER